jgi:altronate hydrolase
MNKQTFLRIENRDNLIVALQTIAEGTTVNLDGEVIELRQKIPAKHKFASIGLEIGDTAIMYGITVGKATRQILAGELITTENLKHATTAYKEQQDTFQWAPPLPYESFPAEFMGFRRENGAVGTANYWIFVPLVFCSNQELYQLKEILPRVLGYTKTTRYEKYAEKLVEQIKGGKGQSGSVIAFEAYDEKPNPLFPHIDGLRFLTHSAGCGNTPEDIESLCALLANYITHPNVAGATVISLGCQKAELSTLQNEIKRRDPDGLQQVLYFDRQSWNQPTDMLEAVIQQTFAGLQEANKTVRQPVPITELVVGVECGGSDGFSGISANPVIGKTIDHLVGAGASAILSEFPELCGVENELVSRCESPQIAERFLHLLNSYRKRVQAVGADFDLNPSPGNIRDGLITDAMKSAGAAKKGGTSPVVDVLDYVESLVKRGLNLLCTPGNDVESTTALVGSGANLIIFSTGLGTPTGNPIVPVLKVSTNSSLAKRLEYMIDIDTGPIISGEETLDGLAEQLLKLCVETASGSYEAKASRLGQEDFIPWKRGVSL